MVSEDGHDHGEERRESEKGRDKGPEKKSKRSSRDRSRDRKRSRERKRSSPENKERNRGAKRSERGRSRDRSGERPTKRHKTLMSPSDEPGSSPQAENMREMLQWQSSKSPGRASASSFESPFKQLQGMRRKTRKQKLGPYEALARARRELKKGDSVQAGEKAWLAVDKGLKELATNFTFPISWLETHRGKGDFARHLAIKYDPEIRQLFGVAAALHSNFYGDFMSDEEVGDYLEDIDELLRIFYNIEKWVLRNN